MNLFTMVDFHLHTIIICPGITLEGLQSNNIFSFKKIVDIQEKKEQNPDRPG